MRRARRGRRGTGELVLGLTLCPPFRDRARQLRACAWIAGALLGVVASVLHAVERNEISRVVVSTVAIDVVNIFAVRELPPIGPLPDQAMFRHSTVLVREVVSWHGEHPIAPHLIAATLPVRRCRPARGSVTSSVVSVDVTQRIASVLAPFSVCNPCDACPPTTTTGAEARRWLPPTGGRDLFASSIPSMGEVIGQKTRFRVLVPGFGSDWAPTPACAFGHGPILSSIQAPVNTQRGRR